jgi:hypothetical protein
MPVYRVSGMDGDGTERSSLRLRRVRLDGEPWMGRGILILGRELGGFGLPVAGGHKTSLSPTGRRHEISATPWIASKTLEIPRFWRGATPGVLGQGSQRGRCGVSHPIRPDQGGAGHFPWDPGWSQPLATENVRLLREGRCPTPGPAGSTYAYGHVSVAHGLPVTQPAWGVIALPPLARLFAWGERLDRHRLKHLLSPYQEFTPWGSDRTERHS